MAVNFSSHRNNKETQMKFKCKLSGVVVEFTQEQDIKTTLENENYEVVEDKPVVEEKPKAKKLVKDEE
jgi:hypothetical protein